jgi:predicted membrane channel-forming protein YqfA (hemolysin III family)
MEWPSLRTAVVGIAAAGGVLAVAAMLLQDRPGRARLARQLNAVAYVFMGISMLFFILAGLLGRNG